MTREEKEKLTIIYFKNLRKRFCEDYLLGIPKDSVADKATMVEKEFYDIVIQALEKEPCEDAISRQAVLDLCERFDGCVPYSVLSSHDMLPSVSTEKTAIDCSDSICRADAIKLVKSYIHEIITESGVDKNSHTNKILTDIVESLAFELSPVTPAQKMGRWIVTDDDAFVYCSECEDSYYSRPIDASWYYCPNCGAKMEVEE